MTLVGFTPVTMIWSFPLDGLGNRQFGFIFIDQFAGVPSPVTAPLTLARSLVLPQLAFDNLTQQYREALRT